MASVQCYKPTDQQPCHQQQHQSFSQKVTHAVTSVFKKDHTHQAHHQAHATNQCNITTNNGHFPVATTNHETNCHGNGKTRRIHNKKMKDGLSGHNSDSSSSIESDSDDDNKCARNKN